MTEITLSGVTTSGRDPRAGLVHVLEGLDLVIPSGGVTTLIGPAGSGKTTILRVIAGLESLDAGTVRFDGVDVTRSPTRERDVALVTQQYAAYPHLTVREQLAGALGHRGVDPTDAEQRLAAEARTLGLDAVLDRKPSTLSAGDRQRLALGRALMRRPQVILLDEPFGALDAPERARLRAELVELCHAAAVTTVHATHDVAEAMALADRLAVLDAGRVAQVEAPAVCYHRPASATVAEAVGAPTVRLVDAEVVGRELRIAGVTLALTSGQARAIGRRRRVLVAVRAQRLELAGDPDALPGVPVAVTVERVLALGPTLDVEVATAPGEPGAPRFVARVTPSAMLRPGDPAILRLDLGECSIFDADDGRALHHGREHGPA